MSGRRRLRFKVRDSIDDYLTSKEYRKASKESHEDVADTSSDQDTGVHIRGPKASIPLAPGGRMSGNPAKTNFGRRRTDMKSDHIITKKLVVLTVILVDAMYLAGDALLTGQDLCP